MRNFKILFLAAVLPLLCITARAQMTDANAGKLIDLTNAVITISNQYGGKYQNYENVVSQGEKLYQRYTKEFDPRFNVNFNGTGSFPLPPIYRTQYENALKAMPASMAETNAIGNAVEEAYSATGRLEYWGKRMKTYFEGKEFADDGFEGYAEIDDSLRFFLSETQLRWKNAVRIASEAGDRAELQLLKGHPIVEFLTPMKNDLRELRNVLTDFYDIEDEDPDYTSIKAEMERLKADISSHSSLEGKNVSVLRHTTYYTSYYEHMEKCLDNLILLVGALEAEEPGMNDIERYNNNVNYYFDRTINSYNNFAESGMK